MIMNTWFAAHPRHRYTWISPGDRARNQIDCIMINKRFGTCISNARAYPGTDVSSDHNPVIAKFKIHLRALKRSKRKPWFLIDALKNPEINAKFFAAALEKLSKNRNKQNSQNQWKSIKKSITIASTKYVPKDSKKLSKHIGQQIKLNILCTR